MRAERREQLEARQVREGRGQATRRAGQREQRQERAGRKTELRVRAEPRGRRFEQEGERQYAAAGERQQSPDGTLREQAAHAEVVAPGWPEDKRSTHSADRTLGART